MLRARALRKGIARERRKAITEAIERVVDGTDSRIRFVRGYKSKLQGVIESSYAYFDDLVEQIPGVIEINKDAFAMDPRVHAFFITVEDMQNKFSRSSELRHFIEDENSENTGDIFALLCMQKKEKTVFGMELEGEFIKRDVAQISVGFSDHQLLALACSEHEARLGLKECLFEQLVTTALDDINTVQLEHKEIEAQKRLLLTQLRALEARRRRSASASKSSLSAEHRLNKELEEHERALNEIKLKLLPKRSLDQTREILSHPERYISVDKVYLKLNNMSIKLKEDSQEQGSEINLAEIKFAKAPSRVVILAKYPRKEILPKEDFLERVTPYLSP
jgi:hypothetical protein